MLAQAHELGGSRRRGRPEKVERVSPAGPPCLWRPVGTEAVRGAPRGGWDTAQLAVPNTLEGNL